MNESIVKKTQDTLGKIIGKKPPLTEKLLNRPPFRFLHDVFTSVSIMCSAVVLYCNACGAVLSLLHIELVPVEQL